MVPVDVRQGVACVVCYGCLMWSVTLETLRAGYSATAVFSNSSNKTLTVTVNNSSSSVALLNLLGGTVGASA